MKAKLQEHMAREIIGNVGKQASEANWANPYHRLVIISLGAIGLALTGILKAIREATDTYGSMAVSQMALDHPNEMAELQDKLMAAILANKEKNQPAWPDGLDFDAILKDIQENGIDDEDEDTPKEGAE